MKCIFLLAAETILVDYHTKRVSAINILESFAATTFPLPLQFMILVAVEQTDGDGKNPELLLLVSHEGKEIFKRKENVPFEDGYKVSKSITNFGTIIISSPGELKFELTQGDQSLREFIVRITSAATTPPLKTEIVPLP